MEINDQINYEKRLLNLEDVLMFIDDALQKGKPLSIGRYRHIEIAYIGWNLFPEWTILLEPYSAYSGATGSMTTIKNELEKALRRTDIVGPHASWGQAWEDKETAKLTGRLLHNLDFKPEKICSAFITHDMIKNMQFWTILKDRKIALVGRRAAEAAPLFIKGGFNVTYTRVLEGYAQIEEAYQDLASRDWDIALVAAGIPATILSPRLANHTNRVVIDFGHALDKFIDGENFNYEKILKDWKAGASRNYLVSMVMAVHNGGRFLEETLKHALYQSYSNLEIIIVNDGSSDSTKQILDRIRDDRVKVIHLEENQGAAKALNLGIREARGEWVAIQDADDNSYPTRIEEQVKYIQEHPQLVGVGTLIKCISGDADIPDSVYEGLTASRNNHKTRDEIRNIIYWGCPLTHSSVMFSKEVFWEVGGYDPQFKIAYDYDLWLKLLEKGEMEKVENVLLDYRIHKGSLSNKDGLATVNEIQIASSRAIYRAFHQKKGGLPKVIVIGPERACRNYKARISIKSGIKVEKLIYTNKSMKISSVAKKLKGGQVDAVVVLDHPKKEFIIQKLSQYGLQLNKHFFLLYNIL